MRILIALVAVLPLLGCQSKLSKDQVELLAAVAYITYGMEEGNNKFSSERVDRQVHSDEVEYLVYSKRDGPVDMHMRVRNPSACVFTIDTRGDGKGYVEKLDFNRATKFEFGVSGTSRLRVRRSIAKMTSAKTIRRFWCWNKEARCHYLKTASSQ